MLDFIQAIKEHYTAIALLKLMPEPTTPQHDRAISNLQEYSIAYTNGLASLMRDYILLSAIGEARNAPKQCSLYIEGLHPSMSRAEAGEEGLRYSPESIVDSLTNLFGEGHWSSSYGGEAWNSGLKALDLFQDKGMFIDRCVDLQHNGGSLFDKSDYRLIAVYPNLGEYLEFKRYADAVAQVERYIFEWPSETLLSIIRKLERLGLLVINPTADLGYYSGVDMDVLGYAPKLWGTETLPYAVDGGGPYSDDDYNEEENEEQEEDGEEDEEGEEEGTSVKGTGKKQYKVGKPAHLSTGNR